MFYEDFFSQKHPICKCFQSSYILNLKRDLMNMFVTPKFNPLETNTLI